MGSITHATTASGVNNAGKQVSVNAWNEDHDLTNIAQLDVEGVFEAPQRTEFVPVTAVSGTHTLDFNAGMDFTLTAVAGVNTIATSNIPATCQKGSFELVHSGSATQSLAWGSAFRFTGTAPSIPSSAGRLMFYYAINSAGQVVVTAWGNIT